MMATKKRVAVIGAGISGVTSVKACLEEGLEPVCFEQFNSLGGVWYYTDEYREGQGASAFENLASNISKDMMCFSDFPFPPDDPPFVSCKMVCSYLQNYCDTFGLSRHFHFNTKVRCVRKSSDYDVTGRWEVEIQDKNGVRYEIFDFVMICSGYYKNARFPDVEDLDSFKGSIDHSQTFRSGQKYKGQRVLVVGNSHSAADMSSMISDFAEQVYLAVGRGMWLLSKFGKNGTPWDFIIHRRANFWNFENLDKLIVDFANNRLDQAHSGFSPSTPPTQSRVSIGDGLPVKLMTGRVKILGDLTRLGPQEAEFADGTVIRNLDAILFSTGYDLRLDILDEKLKGDQGKLSLYKMVFPLQLPLNTLALVGFVETDGAIPPVAELQARLVSRVFARNHKLQPPKVLAEDVERWNTFVYERYGRYKYLIPSTIFRDEIAAELGITPSWWDLIKAGPRLAYLYYYGPAFPYHFRLWGPHPWPGAKKAIAHALECGNYASQVRKAPAPKEGGSKHSYTFSLAVLCLSGAFLSYHYLKQLQ